MWSLLPLLVSQSLTHTPSPPPFFQDLDRLYPDERDNVHITLVEARDILSSFDDRLRAYTENLIKTRGAMEIVKASVNEVTATHVRFDNGRRIPCGMVVWSAGLAPRYADVTRRVYTVVWIELNPKG